MGDSYAGKGFDDTTNTEPSAKPRSPAHNAVMTWLRSFPSSEVGASQVIEYIETLELEIAQNRQDAAAIAGVPSMVALATAERIDRERDERWVREIEKP